MEPTADLVDELNVIDSELRAVDAALQRLQDGTYGRCERCGEAIGEADLAANALLRTCPDHTD